MFDTTNLNNAFKWLCGGYTTTAKDDSQSIRLYPDAVQRPTIYGCFLGYFIVLFVLVWKQVRIVDHSTSNEGKSKNQKDRVPDNVATTKHEKDKKELSCFAGHLIIVAAYVLLYISTYVFIGAPVSSCLVISQAAPYLIAVLAATCLNWHYHYWESSKFGILRICCVAFGVLAIVLYILAMGATEGVDDTDIHRYNVHAVGDQSHRDLQKDLANNGALSKDTLLSVTKTYMHSVNVDPKQDIPERTSFATFSLVKVWGTLAATTGALALLETFLICEDYGSKNGPATAPFSALAVTVFLLLVCWYNPYAVAYGPFHGILTWFAKPVTEWIAVFAFCPSSVITFLSSIHGGVWSILSALAGYFWHERKAAQRKREEEEAELRKEQRRKADAWESREHAFALREESRMRRIQK